MGNLRGRERKWRLRRLQIKAENPTNDAIIDDTAGQAYVEQFALETFQRADKTVQANKVSK
jgi:vacuolar protein sorting-associated protein VTA1